MNIKLLSLITISLVLSACGVKKVNPEPTLQSIEVYSQPTKIEYIVGENFDPTGLIINTNFSNNTNVQVAYAENENLFSFIPNLTTPLQTSDTSVQITYEGKTTSTQITVTQPVTETYTIDFSTMNLGSTRMLQSQDGSFKEKTLEFIGNNTNNYIDDIDYSGQNRIKFVKEEFPSGFDSPQALILASQDYDGFLEMQFNKIVYSVEIKAQQYYKLFTYGGSTVWGDYDCQHYDENDNYVADPDASLYVNEQEMNIPALSYEYDESGTTQIINIPQMAQGTLLINDYNLTLVAQALYRIRVFELKITFIV